EGWLRAPRHRQGHRRWRRRRSRAPHGRAPLRADRLPGEPLRDVARRRRGVGLNLRTGHVPVSGTAPLTDRHGRPYPRTTRRPRFGSGSPSLLERTSMATSSSQPTADRDPGAMVLAAVEEILPAIAA